MNLFTQVSVKNPNKEKEYIITARSNRVAFDDREGPYYWVQEVPKGKASRIKKANFMEGKFYHHSDVMLKS